MSSIYERIGGHDSVAETVDDFYRRVLGDPELAPYFENTDVARLKSHQRAFIAAAIGGPEPYQGRGMASAHAGLEITGPHFDLVVSHLIDSLTDLEVPSEMIEEIGTKLAPLKDEIVTA